MRNLNILLIILFTSNPTLQVKRLEKKKSPSFCPNSPWYSPVSNLVPTETKELAPKPKKSSTALDSSKGQVTDSFYQPYYKDNERVISSVEHMRRSMSQNSVHPLIELSSTKDSGIRCTPAQAQSVTSRFAHQKKTGEHNMIFF